MAPPPKRQEELAIVLASLNPTGGKARLDDIEPNEIATNRSRGASRAASKPSITAKVVGSGQFDDRIAPLIAQTPANEQIAWALS